MARCVQSRMIVTEKARLRALRERRTIPSPSGKSTIRVLRKKVRSECFGKSAVRVLREKRGPSVSGKVHDPESVGKKHGSEQSDRYRKSAAPSRMIITEKARSELSRGRCMIPSPSGKSAAPSRVIVTEKARLRVFR